MYNNNNNRRYSPEALKGARSRMRGAGGRMQQTTREQRRRREPDPEVDKREQGEQSAVKSKVEVRAECNFELEKKTKENCK